MRTIILSLALLLNFNSVFSQPYAKWDSKSLTLDNGEVKRTIILPSDEKNGLETESVLLNGNDRNFVKTSSDEFYFEVNGSPVSGKSGWEVREIREISDSLQGNGAEVLLSGLDDTNSRLELSVKYLLYPGSPVIRKQMAFINTGSENICIESLDVEKLRSNLDFTFTWMYNNYGRNKTVNGYSGNFYDPVVVVHEVTGNCGLVLGNEAPGVLKKTTAMIDGTTVTLGYCHAEHDYPLRKWLKPGETWNSHFMFIMPYANQPDPSEVLNTIIADFVRKNMGIRLSNSGIPTSVYNTWKPFHGDLTTASMIDLTKSVAQCGFEYFVMDAGWNTIDGKPVLTGDNSIDWILNLGDWKEDPDKFPNGLKEVFDEVRRLGMKPGLWISVATSTKNAKVYREHPEWFVQDEQGNPVFLHDESGNPNQVTACLGGAYFDYIKGKMLHLIKTHGLKYVKLDLAILTSAYRYNPYFTGCSAKNHEHHADREESYLAIYERCFKLFDELHAEVPDLFIDCTFETMGKLQLIDFDMIKHAEGNWLSNIDEKAPKGSWRVRQLAWSRSPVIPASSMVIGNMILDQPDFQLAMKSNSGSMPIMLGDARKLSPSEKAMVKEWTSWMRLMENKHQIMLYRQDLSGFGEPQDGAWDGFQRINTDSGSGGIVGVFRQGAAETTRTVTVKYLNPETLYKIVTFPENKEIGVMDGNNLSKKGFTVTIEKNYDGSLFEIRKVTEIKRK